MNDKNKNSGKIFRQPVTMRMIFCIALFLCLTGCSKYSIPGSTGTGGSNGSAPQKHKISFFAMDTAMSITAYGEDSLFDGGNSPLDEAGELIRSLESGLSVTDENSMIYRINHAAGNEVPIDAETAELLENALILCQKTDGALDITVYPVVRAWGFTTGVYRIPDNEELNELLKNVDYRKIRTSFISDSLRSANSVDDPALESSGSSAETESDSFSKAESGLYSIRVERNMMLDLGAVAKGYAAEKTADLLKKRGISSAVISLGGNIKTIGTRPDGSDWNIAIAAPIIANNDSSTDNSDEQGLSDASASSEPSGYAGILKVSDMSVVTSGGYERYFEEGGKHYCHIIDPATGNPVDNGILSVTVIAEDSLLCDALSTALFVMGPEKAEEFWRSSLKDDQINGFDYLMITGDNRIIITEGITDTFTVDPTYSDHSISILYHLEE